MAYRAVSTSFVLAVVGCGRFAFDPAPLGDALPTGVDALPPFGTPVPLTALNSTFGDDDPSLTEDMLEIYFNTNRPGGPGLEDVWIATRASTTDAFGNPVPVVELSSPSTDVCAEVSPDGLTMYLASDRGTTNRDFFVATRPDRASPWTTPARVAELSTPEDETCVAETVDGLAVYFSATRGGGSDIFMATRAARGQPWGNIVSVLARTGIRESQPWLHPDATAMYYDTTEPGSEGIDIWMVERAQRSDPFSAPIRVLGIQSALDEVDPWLSTDQRTIYFARIGGPSIDLYTATR